MLYKSNYDFISDGDDIKIIDDVVPPFSIDDRKTDDVVPDDVIRNSPIETGNEIVDDKNWDAYVKILETHRPDLLFDESDNNLILPVETDNQTIDDKNWADYVKILETHRPDLLVDEPDSNLIPSIETGKQTIGDKNWADYVKILEIHRPNYLVGEPDNVQDDRQNLIYGYLFKKDLVGKDIILSDSIIKIEPNIDVLLKEVPSIDPTIRVTNENDGNQDLINIPSPKWIQPGDRFKRRVRHSNRKKVYSREKQYRRKAKEKAIQTLIKRHKSKVQETIMMTMTLK